MSLSFFFFSIYLLDTESQLEEDEQLARALQESLNVESPPRHDAGNIFQPFPSFFSPGYRYMLLPVNPFLKV